MTHKIVVEIENERLEEINSILDKSYVDLSMFIQMVINRSVQENSINWITQNQLNRTMIIDKKEEKYLSEQKNDSINNINHITKSIASRLFKSKGLTVNASCTFATKNKSSYNYWANPNFELLDYDWTLILNDNIKNKLYLFNIPKNTFVNSDFISRGDNIDKIDLQIMYNDTTFTDNRSGVSFAKFLVYTINY